MVNINISIQTGILNSAPCPRRHEELAQTIGRDDIISSLIRLDKMNKAFNKGAGDLVKSPDNLEGKTIEELRELYIEITGKML